MNKVFLVTVTDKATPVHFMPYIDGIYTHRSAAVEREKKLRPLLPDRWVGTEMHRVKAWPRNGNDAGRGV